MTQFKGYFLIKELKGTLKPVLIVGVISLFIRTPNCQLVNTILKPDSQQKHSLRLPGLNSRFDRTSVKYRPVFCFFFLPLSENCKKSNVQRLFSTVRPCMFVIYEKTKQFSAFFKKNLFLYKVTFLLLLIIITQRYERLTLCRFSRSHFVS